MIGVLINWLFGRRTVRDPDFDPELFGESWTCYICGERRPDANISVFSSPIVIEGKSMGQRNVRHCNDRARCIHEAKTFRFSSEGSI